MSSTKRPREDEAEDGGGGPHVDGKKRKGFRVGPENLPDGPWRRKGTVQLFPPPDHNPPILLSACLWIFSIRYIVVR